MLLISSRITGQSLEEAESRPCQLCHPLLQQHYSIVLKLPKSSVELSREKRPIKYSWRVNLAAHALQEPEKQRNVPQPLPLPLLFFDPVLAVLRKAAFFTTHLGMTKCYLYSFAQLFYINPQPNVNSENTAFMLEY